MSTTITPPETFEDRVEEPEHGFWSRRFGPLTPWRVVALLAVFTFFGGAVGWVLQSRSATEGHNEVDVGFSQDMIAHHDQAIEMALTVLADPTLPSAIRSAAQEIVIFQRYEIGLLNDTLARWGKSVEGNGTSMAWMGMPVRTDEMPGLATDAEMNRLSEAKGRDAAALFLAMMSRHHQAGVDMANYASRYGKDGILRRLAASMATNQASEIREYRATRRQLGLGVPKGFTDPPSLPAMMDMAPPGSGGIGLGRVLTLVGVGVVLVAIAVGGVRATRRRELT